MRLIKVVTTVLLAVFALLAGLFTAMLVAIGGAFIYLFRRLAGSATPARASRPPSTRSGGSRNGDDIIDVTATEVPADPAAR